MTNLGYTLILHIGRFVGTVRLMRKLMCICRESPFTVRHFTVLKLGGEQLKKVEVLRLQRLLRSASTLWKDWFFLKVWYDCGTRQRVKEKVLNF